MNQTYRLVFHSESNNFGVMEKFIEEMSDHMAECYASKLLQNESNTMFHTVDVFDLHEYAGQNDRLVATVELVMTRGTKRREI